jgi:uncharacterized protein YecT (DUF1311 family)
MRKSLSATLLLLPLMAFSPAGAEEITYSAEYTVCIDTTNGSLPDIIACIQAERDRWDKRLNVSYKKLMATLTADQQKKVRSAQRLWLQFLQQNCDLPFVIQGDGQLPRLNASHCDLDMLARRTVELESLIME